MLYNTYYATYNNTVRLLHNHRFKLVYAMYIVIRLFVDRKAMVLNSKHYSTLYNSKHEFDTSSYDLVSIKEINTIFVPSERYSLDSHKH